MSELKACPERLLTEEFLMDYPIAEGLVELVLMKIDRALTLPGHHSFNWRAIDTLKLVGYPLTDASHCRLKLATKVGVIIIPRPF